MWKQLHKADLADIFIFYSALEEREVSEEQEEADEENKEEVEEVEEKEEEMKEAEEEEKEEDGVERKDSPPSRGMQSMSLVRAMIKIMNVCFGCLNHHIKR